MTFETLRTGLGAIGLCTALASASCSSSGGSSNGAGPGDGGARQDASGADASRSSDDDASGSSSGSDAMGGCMYAETSIGVNDMTPLGVTPAALIAMVSGTHLATLTWAGGVQDVTVTPPPGTTALTIDVTPMTDPIFYDQSSGTLCAPGALTIPATVRFVTADGGFNETWQVSLSSNDGKSLTFTRDLLATPPTGTFRVTYTGSMVGNENQDRLTATFDAAGANGNVQFVNELVSTSGPDMGSGGGLVFNPAIWAPLAPDAGLDAAPGADAMADSGGD
jgi:hypothetical protein